MRSANPALKPDTFNQLSHAEKQDAMTIQGTVNKTLIALGALLLSASWIWSMGYQDVLESTDHSP